MTGQRDIFNPAANPEQQDAPKPKRPGSGAMSEAQWQAWMGRVADRMRRMAEDRQGNHAA